MPAGKEIIKEPIAAKYARATFAGGCFWCLESNFQALQGVGGAINGYAGGSEFNPTYENVYMNQTTHREAVLVYYEENKIPFKQLLKTFWQNIDPTDSEGQFFDRGLSYTTAIFYHSDQQRELALKSLEDLQKHFKKPIATKILPYTTFYEAEAYHQDFYQKSPQRYKDYVHASGREEYKKLVWQAILKDQAQES